MLEMVYIIRIDNKDFCITPSVCEATDYFLELKENPALELVNTEMRSHSTTYNYRHI